MKSDIFLGKTKKGAQDTAEKHNMIFRLIRIDQDNFCAYPDTDDICDARVSIEIDNGKVTHARLG